MKRQSSILAKGVSVAVFVAVMLAIGSSLSRRPAPRRSMTRASLETVRSALEKYRLERGVYPDGLDVLRLSLGCPEELPVIDAWGNPLRYNLLAEGNYTQYSVGRDGKDGTDDDLHD